MRVSICVLLFCVGTVLSQGKGPKGPPPGPPGPAQQGPPPGPPPDAVQGGPQPEPVQYSVQQPDQGTSGGAHGTTDPSAANPWHELLHRMMDLMTAAASGGPLPSDPPSNLGAHHSTGQHVDSGKPKTPPHSKPKNSPVHHDTMPPTQPTQPPSQPPTQPPTQPKQTPSKPQPPRPVVADCFWEGKFYRPGSDIVRGQHDRWCYVTYCDSNGKIQFWDDYNCPPNSMKPTSSHSSGSGRNGQAPGQKKAGCHHKGMYYEPGQEIDQHNVGERCYGTYCSQDSKVVQWEDWCTSGTTTVPTTRMQPPPKPKGGKKKGKGRRGKKQQRRGGGGGQEIEGRRPRQQGGGQRRGGGGGRGGGKRRISVQGCYHNALYYQPNEDVIVGNIGDMCYGYYCEGNNVFVHWEDNCTPTTPVAPTTMSMGAGNFYFKK